MQTLYLLFPQWQGSGKSQELYRGAKLLQKELAKDFNFTEIDVSLSNDLELKNEILGYETIKQQLNSATKTIAQNEPEKIFTIGGDCSVELAPLSYLNKKYHGDLGVIWFDAHGDLNTPSSSPSKQFHGMPLRTLLDEGDKAIREMLFSKLKPEQFFFAGVRDLDPPEKEFIKNNNIAVFSVDSIRAKGFKKIYIHIDLDVLDPNEFPNVKCPTPQGMSVEKLLNSVQQLKKNFSVVGASVVEFSPKEDGKIDVVKSIVKELFER